MSSLYKLERTVEIRKYGRDWKYEQVAEFTFLSHVHQLDPCVIASVLSRLFVRVMYAWSAHCRRCLYMLRARNIFICCCSFLAMRALRAARASFDGSQSTSGDQDREVFIISTHPTTHPSRRKEENGEICGEDIPALMGTSYNHCMSSAFFLPFHPQRATHVWLSSPALSYHVAETVYPLCV